MSGWMGRLVSLSLTRMMAGSLSDGQERVRMSTPSTCNHRILSIRRPSRLVWRRQTVMEVKHGRLEVLRAYLRKGRMYECE